MKLLFICALLVAHTLAASITPVTENPIPKWASARDICTPTRSCDNCASAQYCKYVQTTPHCCEPPMAAIKPVEQNPIPSWASPSDVCMTKRSCDDCTDRQYCKYVQTNGGVKAQCCTGSTQPRTVASITPIVNQIPSWASPSDICTKVRTCDDCGVTDSTYCKYTKKGNAKCCSRSGVVPSPTPATATASITPIVENPIPTWASPSDICVIRRSCDDCGESQYCKYVTSATGKVQSQCCGAANKKQFVASITPIVDQIPSWATKSDICMKVRTCDECTTGDDTYCKYTKKGNAKCCTRAEGATQQSGSITPITENPIPSWASPNDICVRKRSCDACLENQYCKYTMSGRPSCCSAPGQATAKPNMGEASISPITENPIPSWASASDICVTQRSCDACGSGQYCKYSANGQASCCARAGAATAPATVQPIQENPIPTWASPSDMCLQVRTCDDCNANGRQYCKYSNSGKALCCSKLL